VQETHNLGQDLRGRCQREPSLAGRGRLRLGAGDPAGTHLRGRVGPFRQGVHALHDQERLGQHGNKDCKPKFFVGIEDDVTHLSLK